MLPLEPADTQLLLLIRGIRQTSLHKAAAAHSSSPLKGVSPVQEYIPDLHSPLRRTLLWRNITCVYTEYIWLYLW